MEKVDIMRSAYVLLLTVACACGADAGRDALVVGQNDGSTDLSGDSVVQYDGTSDVSGDASRSHGCSTASPCPAGSYCNLWHECCGQGSVCVVHAAGPGTSCNADEQCLDSQYCQSGGQCCPVGAYCDANGVDAAASGE
jgi:hypothetical protein